MPAFFMMCCILLPCFTIKINRKPLRNYLQQPVKIVYDLLRCQHLQFVLNLFAYFCQCYLCYKFRSKFQNCRHLFCCWVSGIMGHYKMALQQLTNQINSNDFVANFEKKKNQTKIWLNDFLNCFFG